MNIENKEFVIRYEILAGNLIVKKKVNLMSVDMVKGLEFDRALVISEGMTKNENYIACTRALNELYIYEQSL